jgi:uncharacterized Zn finger protein (UPF0148 family)
MIGTLSNDYADELIYCPICGRDVPWKHKEEKTMRAKVRDRIVPVLTRAIARVEDWVEAGAVRS